MKNLSLVALIFLFSVDVFAQYNAENLSFKKTNVTGLIDLSYKHDKLQLFPIIGNASFHAEHKTLGDYTPLKDALENHKIVITETGAINTRSSANSSGSQPVSQQNNAGSSSVNNRDHIQLDQVSNLSGGVSGQVNTLIAENTSADTIFIMAGEIVKGGKQDRMVGQDIVIAPGKKVNLAAYCVEKSRWVTKEGNQGRFTGYFNVSSSSVRKAAVKDKNQSAVWNNVDQVNQKNKTETSTKTYTALANSEEYQKQLNTYMDFFKSKFDQEKDVIGVVAVSGDKVIGCDLFATHDLFEKAYNNLLHSYIAEAITNGKKVDIKEIVIQDYLSNILKEENKQDERIKNNGEVYKHQGKKLHITTF